MDNNKEFNDAYWAHQPPEVRVLRGIPETESAHLAQDLAAKFPIDVPIMIWGWDPYKVMVYRKLYGYTWVPAAGQTPILFAPGVEVFPDPSFVRYDPNNPPAGSIKVSTDIADYPPVDAQAPVDPPKSTSHVVGYDMGGGFFCQVDADGDPVTNGEIVTEARGTFRYRKGPAGGWWEKLAA